MDEEKKDEEKKDEEKKDEEKKEPRKTWVRYRQPKGTPNFGGPGVRGGKSRDIAHVGSLARMHTAQAIRVMARIMNDEAQPAMARITAAGKILDRGWGKASETHKINVNDGTSLLKVVNEIVHVHETREQVEFRDQTPLLELVPEDADGNGSKKTH